MTTKRSGPPTTATRPNAEDPTTTVVPCSECGCMAQVYAATDEGRPVRW